jgi:hypothetical protein
MFLVDDSNEVHNLYLNSLILFRASSKEIPV